MKSMQLSIPTADFASALEIVTRFVSKHATLPILENIYLSTSVDSLTLKGTDMEKHIQLTIPATITQEGAITINAKTLHNIIKTLESDTIDMTLSKDETLTITTSRDNFSIRGIAASEYVALPDVQATSSTTIDTNILIQGISKVEYAVSDKNFSPVLTGILAQTTKNGDQHSIAFAGSDSFRLAEYKTQIPSSDADISVIIPKTNIIEIQKVGEYQIKNEGSDTDISIGDNMISFTFRTDSGIDILVSSLLIQGNFPNYNTEAIIPTTFNASIILSSTELDKAIKKILILTKDINNYLMIHTQEDSVSITSGSTDKGNAKVTIPAVVTGEKQSIGINGKYISDFIRNTSASDIHIHIVDEQKPLVLKDPHEDNYTYVARPLLK